MFKNPNLMWYITRYKHYIIPWIHHQDFHFFFFFNLKNKKIKRTKGEDPTKSSHTNAKNKHPSPSADFFNCIPIWCLADHTPPQHPPNHVPSSSSPNHICPRVVILVVEAVVPAAGDTLTLAIKIGPTCWPRFTWLWPSVSIRSKRFSFRFASLHLDQFICV